MLSKFRSKLVVFHRWAGLVIALFLTIAGITGSLLVWNDELEALISPDLFIARAEGRSALDPLELRARVLKAYPGTEIIYVPLRHAPDATLIFRLAPSKPVAPGSLANDQVFVDPYTGKIAGERKWGDISQGSKNLMPFIYRLHRSLALDSFGTYLLGIVALIWTVDCFVGAWLTLPAGRRQPAQQRNMRDWLQRWWPAWKVKFNAAPLRRNYDMHRAGGLWPWAALFVLAWSSVAFNLPEVYEPVMRGLLMSPREARLPKPAVASGDIMSWQEARTTGRLLMQDFSHQADFKIIEEGALAYFAQHGVYRYDVYSELDVRTHGSKTRVFFDAVSGELRRTDQPTGRNAADTVRMWITAIHIADVWGLPLRIFICLTGLIVAMLSITGVYLWWKKRRARQVLRRMPQSA